MAIIISCCCTWNIRRTHSKKRQQHKKKGSKAINRLRLNCLLLLLLWTLFFAVHRTIQHPNCCNGTNNQNVFKLWVHFNHFIWKNIMSWTVCYVLYVVFGVLLLPPPIFRCNKLLFIQVSNFILNVHRLSFLQYFFFLFFNESNENVKRRTFEIVQLMPFGYVTTKISVKIRIVRLLLFLKRGVKVNKINGKFICMNRRYCIFIQCFYALTFFHKDSSSETSCKIFSTLQHNITNGSLNSIDWMMNKSESIRQNILFRNWNVKLCNGCLLLVLCKLFVLSHFSINYHQLPLLPRQLSRTLTGCTEFHAQEPYTGTEQILKKKKIQITTAFPHLSFYSFHVPLFTKRFE